jgi:hypothetical protein
MSAMSLATPNVPVTEIQYAALHAACFVSEEYMAAK